MKNAQHIFFRAQSDVFKFLFTPTDRYKPKDLSFTLKNEKKRQLQILTS